jgi:hypothetical protein
VKAPRTLKYRVVITCTSERYEILFARILICIQCKKLPQLKIDLYYTYIILHLMIINNKISFNEAWEILYRASHNFYVNNNGRFHAELWRYSIWQTGYNVTRIYLRKQNTISVVSFTIHNETFDGVGVSTSILLWWNSSRCTYNKWMVIRIERQRQFIASNNAQQCIVGYHKLLPLMVNANYHWVNTNACQFSFMHRLERKKQRNT